MLVQRHERIMATRVGAQVAIHPEQAAAARAAVDACLDWMREVDRRLTRFTAESDLSRLNGAAGEWVVVSGMLFEVVERSLLAAEATDGLFDPTILPALEALGYDRDFSAIAFREASAVRAGLSAASSPGRWREIALDRARRRIRLPDGVRLDLGGIAKGWAADVALERFFGDFPNVLVDVGGDLRARGEVEAGSPWPVGVGAGVAIRGNLSGPTPEQQAIVTLGRGGLATSGATSRWWLRDGARTHHLIDPRTGQPARIWIDASDTVDGAPLIASASAFAPTAAEAEVAAKVALLRGYPAALEEVEAREDARAVMDDAASAGGAGPDTALLLTLSTGAVVFSLNLPAYLARMGGGGDLWIS